MIFCFPPWGKADFRWFLIFPREGKAILIVFWFSLTGDNLFSPIFTRRTPTKASFCRFSFIVPRIWTDFRENWWFTPVSGQIFQEIDNLLSYLNSIFWKSAIYYRIWAVFHENRQFTPVSGQFFMKIDNLLSYLNSFSWKLMIYPCIWMNFPKKQRKRPFLCSKRVLKWSFLIDLFQIGFFKKAFVFWHCLRFYFASQSISVVALTRLNVSGVICR